MSNEELIGMQSMQIAELRSEAHREYRRTLMTPKEREFERKLDLKIKARQAKQWAKGVKELKRNLKNPKKVIQFSAIALGALAAILAGKYIYDHRENIFKHINDIKKK